MAGATSLIPVSGLTLPAIYTGSPSAEKVVLVLHGLGVSKEVQIPELQRLKTLDAYALAIDAPHHGEREDGYLALMNRQKSDFERHLMLLKIVLQHACEVSSLINFFKEQGKKVAVIGISMGGFVAYSLLNGKIQPDFCAPFLASPDFLCKNRPDGLPVSLLESSGPADKPKINKSLQLFMVNAEKDEVVDPRAAARFYARLQKMSGFDGRKIQHHTYAESQHFMRPADWYDVWEKLTLELSRLC